MAHLAHRAVAIVGRGLDQQRDAARTVALEGDLFIERAGQLTGAALDGALDVVLRHVLRLGCEDRRAQPRITVRVAAPACRHADFLDQAGEDLAALRVQRAFFVLDCGPFRMAGHRTSATFGKYVNRPSAAHTAAEITLAGTLDCSTRTAEAGSHHGPPCDPFTVRRSQA